MHEAFSISREYDYVRLEGLSRATGRPAHEWDLYILKELVDNALDADEALWNRDPQQFPSIGIHIEYISVPPPQCQQLLVRVRNRALFPVERIQSIFATRWYTSRKAFIKRLTRGTLGNALKTLLGIPYALHNRVAEDWGPDLKPLFICCNETEYLPRYIVDSTLQTIDVAWKARTCKPVEGTLISVGVDYFVQERPRTLIELEVLAEQYHLCNPHAYFEWMIEMGGEIWKREYTANQSWTNKFRGVAPVYWYSLTAFKDLLGALYREQFGEERNHMLPLKIACSYFGGLDGELLSEEQSHSPTTGIIEALGRDGLTIADINSSVATELYKALGKYTSHFDSSQLGCIGAEHIRQVLAATFPVKGTIQYKVITEAGRDTYTSTPFIIEVAAAELKEGKRQLWTAINFSPTYSDPFLSRWLHSTMKPNEFVLGLRGVLDLYNLHEDTPFVLFLHLICPTVEHTEFSKTEINHLPFEKELCAAVDQVLMAVRQAREEEELRLEQTIFQALDTIIQSLDGNERFVFEQLVEQLRLQLCQDQSLAAWLERPDAFSRLRAYVANYQNAHPDTINSHVARQAEVMMYIPSHPSRYFSVPIDQISQDLFELHHVNKILYLQARDLEPVFIANNWLCQMDMALLHIPLGFLTLEDAIFQCLHQTDFPVILLLNTKEAGPSLVKQIYARLKQQQLLSERIVDIHLPGAMMSRDLAAWLLKQFYARNISVKTMPPRSQVRQDILGQFERHLQEYILAGIGHRFSLTNFMMELDKTVCYTNSMKNETLDKQLINHLTQNVCGESYAMMLDTLVKEFFERFLEKHGLEVHEMEQVWLAQRQGS